MFSDDDDMLGIVSYCCALVTYFVREIFDLENRVKGLRRSLKMSPFKREPMTSY